MSAGDGIPLLHVCVISYRVKSEKETAKALYDYLTSHGVKVWLDQVCLVPGLPWEDGFCEGLMKSKIFLPLLSKDGLKAFESLLESSSCDNVLLEYRLALDLEKQCLIERIFPLMMGAVDVDEKYLNYFATNCHPKSPMVIVNSVEHKAMQHLLHHGLGSPYLAPLTVSGIVSMISGHQGYIFDGRRDDCFSKALIGIQMMQSSL
jgi:hypothetical protein